jgi:hypothetical protein
LCVFTRVGGQILLRCRRGEKVARVLCSTRQLSHTAAVVG